MHELGKKAEPELLKLFESSENARYRARVLWLLGKIPGRGKHYVERAIADKNADIRIVGLNRDDQRDCEAAAPGEARNDYWILRQIGKRLDPAVKLPSAEDCMRASLDSPYLSTTFEEIRKCGSVRSNRPEIAYAELAQNSAYNVKTVGSIERSRISP